MRKLLIVVLVCGVGCGKKSPTAESCGTLKVTLDGKPLPALTYGLAIKKSTGAYEVDMFNMNKTTCENLLDTHGRMVPEGEVSVKAFAGGTGMMSQGVVYNANTEAGSNIKASLLRIVCGLMLPGQGDVHWNGGNIRTLREDYWKDR